MWLNIHLTMQLSYLAIFLTFMNVSLYSRDSKPLTIVASNSIIRDMVSQISADLAIVYSIVPVGSDPHSYDPKAGDIKLLKDADIIFMNGLHLESWLTRMIENSQTSARIVTVSNGIIPLTDNKSQMTDPHAWMDIKNAQMYIDNILEALIEALPDRKDLLITRYQQYHASLEDLHVYISGLILKIPQDKRFLVTSHDAFRYFGMAYQIKIIPLMGTSTEAEPRTSDFIRLSRIIRQYNIPSVFIESTINPVVLRQLARDLGIRIGGSLYTDSVGPEGTGTETYTGMMRYNTMLIYNALATGTVKNEKRFNFNNPVHWQYGTLILFFVGLSFIFTNKLKKGNV